MLSGIRLALVTIVAAIVLGLLAAVGKTGTDATAASPSPSRVARMLGAATHGTASSRREVKSRSLRVGMVALPGNGGALATFPIAGLRRAARVLGIRGIVLTPPAKEGFAPSLTSLGRQGYDLVFALSLQEAYDTVRAAPRFPHTRFVLLDVSTAELAARPHNILGLVFQEQQVGYLVGYLAALMEDRRRGRHIVSTVGGIKFPPVDRFIAGFQAGARRADPKITLLNGYSDDFADPARCGRVAAGQIAKGSGVVFQVAGVCGLGALDAAREHHVWGIGVDGDQSFLGPHILTSAVKRWDIAVFETVRDFQNNSLPSNGNRFLTLENGALALGKISPEVPRSYLVRVAKVRRDIIAGKIRNIPTSVTAR